MEEFVQIIGHARRFKSATKDLSINDLMEVKAKLEKIIEDRIAKEEESKRKDAEKELKIEKYREMLAADGIAPDELVPEAAATKGKRARRPPKYQIQDESGKVVTWTGQGRMPNVFKARIEAGESLDKYLIK